MSEFDKILKEKVEQFEVPYNDAHWAEMDGRLNKIKATKIKNTILGVAAGVVTLGIVGYFIFSSPTNNTEPTENTITANNTGNTTLLEDNNTTNNSTEETVILNEENKTSENESNLVEEESTQEIRTIELNEKESSTSEIDNLNPSENNLANNDSNTETENTSTNTSFTNKITADFIVYNNKVCVGEKVSFEAIETDAQVSYLWNFGDGKVSYESNPTHTYEHDGIYDVTLTLIDKQTGKENTKIQRGIVQILPLPNTYFTYFEESKKHDDNKLMYPYTMFYVKNAHKGTSYKWNFGNDKTSNTLEAKTIYNKADNYVVTLIAENEYGCIKTIQKRVNIKNGVDLYCANAFTPDGDGLNDVFMPKALTEWDIPFEMIITNKSGRTVYKTSDKNEPWNGKLNNSGQLLNEGIYFWQVVLTDAYGLKHSYQGNIQLIK